MARFVATRYSNAGWKFITEAEEKNERDHTSRISMACVFQAKERTVGRAIIASFTYSSRLNNFRL